MGFYVTDETRHSLLNYRYHGEDRSLLYQYILNPLASNLVDFIPRWIAPNLITVFGLILLIIANMVTYLHSPGLTGPLPDSVYKLCALSIFLYQTLDNLDGKQARRIGNSTPLGLLMDHGVDALAVTITTITMGAIFQTGPGVPLYLLWLMGMIPFTFATWEEYYTGCLVLGVLNGPSDGLALGVICCLLPLIFGSNFWADSIFNHEALGSEFAWLANLTRFQIVLCILIVAVISTVSMNIRNVISYRRANSKSSLGPFKTLVPFLFLLTVSSVWFVYSPNKILTTYPRWCLHTVGFVFGNIACKLMLAHVGNHKYRVTRHSLIPLLLAAVNSVFGAPFNEITIATITLATAVACWLHFVFIAGWEVTDVLGIRVFVVQPPTEEK